MTIPSNIWLSDLPEIEQISEWNKWKTSWEDPLFQVIHDISIDLGKRDWFYLWNEDIMDTILCVQDDNSENDDLYKTNWAIYKEGVNI